MPVHINRYSPAMQGRYHQIKQQVLTSGQLIIGEQHSAPHARAVIMDLMEEGAVGKLFLEIPNDNIQFLNIHRSPSFYHYFEQQRGRNVRLDREWQTLKMYIDASRLHACAVPISTVIEVALSCGVKIYPYDNACRKYPAVRASHLAKRNEVMGRVYNRFSASFNNRATVLLVGSRHNNPIHNLGGQTLSQTTQVGTVIDMQTEYQSALQAINQQLQFDALSFFTNPLNPINGVQVPDVVDMSMIR